jgi:hypothetical protein
MQELIMAVQGGLRFREMTELDLEGFANADPGSLIAESDVAIYILSNDRLDVITDDYETCFLFEEHHRIEL